MLTDDHIIAPCTFPACNKHAAFAARVESGSRQQAAPVRLLVAGCRVGALVVSAANGRLRRCPYEAAIFRGIDESKRRRGHCGPLLGAPLVAACMGGGNPSISASLLVGLPCPRLCKRSSVFNMTSSALSLLAALLEGFQALPVSSAGAGRLKQAATDWEELTADQPEMLCAVEHALLQR